MVYYIVKLFVSAAIIVVVSEVSKRSATLGGVLASLPLVSFLAITWLWIDTHDRQKIADLSWSILWLVLPSLAFFVALPLLMRARFSFYSSMAAATLIMFLCYGAMLLVLRRMGVTA